MSADAFFAYARERHSTYLRRRSGRPRSEWTSDPILRQYRFCNVFRELDRTTIWFRENVRDRLRDQPDVLLATVLFRWFNRIVSGEAVFQQCRTNFSESGAPGETAWEELLRTGSLDGARDSLVCWCGGGPYVTGSYIIKTPDGKSKLDGVLWCIEQFMTREVPGLADYSGSLGIVGWREYAEAMLNSPGCFALHEVWEWLCQFPYLGDFMAYEIITDLRHTALLDRAPDIMIWANPGPGAMRGLNRIHGRPLNSRVSKRQANEEMRMLLASSQLVWYWPSVEGSQHEVPGDFTDWPAWEMRDVEHTLCEFDKYERARLGQGRPRQVFR